MPKYKAIRGIIVSQEPLIKTTTNKIKRHENLKLIKEEKIKGKNNEIRKFKNRIFRKKYIFL